MANTTMTLALNGEVTLDHFAQAMGYFRGLVRALSDELSPQAKIEWLVDDLESGSALATVRGEAPNLEVVEPIPPAFLAVGLALGEGRQVPYSSRVIREANGIASILGSGVTSIRFETQDDDATVISPIAHGRRPTLSGAYGAVEGRVQTVSSRNSLRFTLYDAVGDRAVSCYLEEGRQDLMRDAWDRRAVVEGWVSRDSATGRPVTVRRVQRVDVLNDVVPGTVLRSVRGIAPLDRGQPSAVEVIRKLRDA
jgi:hypothetical protein